MAKKVHVTFEPAVLLNRLLRNTSVQLRFAFRYQLPTLSDQSHTTPKPFPFPRSHRSLTSTAVLSTRATTALLRSPRALRPARTVKTLEADRQPTAEGAYVRTRRIQARTAAAPRAPSPPLLKMLPRTRSTIHRRHLLTLIQPVSKTLNQNQNSHQINLLSLCMWT